MALNSAIEWTESSWNPVTGCSKISAGCRNCYAERMAFRLQAMKQANYKEGFRVKTHEHMLELPLRWRKPQAIFVNSMSDLFHKDVPVDFIIQIFKIMEKASWHRFQVLTKRSERLAELDRLISWPENVWVGVSVESSDYINRIDHLRKIGARVKFISFEPLLGPIQGLNLQNIDWVIVGGESGPGARPMRQEWVIDIRDRCLDSGIPFFFKQWGGFKKKLAGRTLEGRIWSETPHGFKQVNN